MHNISISVIVPFFNAEAYIEKCLNTLTQQNFQKKYEIIMVDDGSNDNGNSIVKKFIGKKNILLFSLDKNSGPSVARNYGLKKAKGDFIFFMDVDDEIEKDTLNLLYNLIINTNCNLVFCDTKWIDNSKNLREKTFFYSNSKILYFNQISNLMQRRIHDPKYFGGIIGSKGRLIRRVFINKNNILYDERLRYLEDEIFLWDILAHLKSAAYLKKQLYCYNVQPGKQTGIINSLLANFSIKKFEIIKQHIENSFRLRGFPENKSIIFGQQAFIFFIINVLLSITKSIIQNKIELNQGLSLRKKIIKDIFNDSNVENSIKNYKVSRDENFLIPKSILWKISWLLELSCNFRAKEIIKFRRKKKN